VFSVALKGVVRPWMRARITQHPTCRSVVKADVLAITKRTVWLLFEHPGRSRRAAISGRIVAGQFDAWRSPGDQVLQFLIGEPI